MEKELSKSDKILLAIAELEKKRIVGDKITVEDTAVQLWTMYPDEFCMKGYPQYPNVDIQKYITKLLDNALITGGVVNYKITNKGIEYAKSLTMKKDKTVELVSSAPPRHIKIEINRIFNSKIFKYYTTTPVPEFVESDLFDFLGTSSRSLTTHDKNIFLARYNLIVKDLIPFCQKNRDENEVFEKIIEIWSELYRKFKEIIDLKVR